MARSEFSRLRSAYIRFRQDTTLASLVVRNVGLKFGKYLTWDMPALGRKKATGFLIELPHCVSKVLPELPPALVNALVLWHVLYSLSVFGNDS